MTKVFREHFKILIHSIIFNNSSFSVLNIKNLEIIKQYCLDKTVCFKKIDNFSVIILDPRIPKELYNNSIYNENHSETNIVIDINKLIYVENLNLFITNINLFKKNNFIENEIYVMGKTDLVAFEIKNTINLQDEKHTYAGKQYENIASFNVEANRYQILAFDMDSIIFQKKHK